MIASSALKKSGPIEALVVSRTGEQMHAIAHAIARVRKHAGKIAKME